MARTIVIPRITLSTLRAAVRHIAEHGRASLKDATLAATKGSPLLAAAMAAEFPFTFCQKDGCDMPLAHEDPCLAA